MLPIARLGGALLLSGAVAALGSALYLAVRRRWVPAIGTVAVLAVLVGGGVIWPLGRPGRHHQGRGGPGRWSAADAVRCRARLPIVIERHLEATRSIDGPVDLVVWPENAINIAGPFADSPVRPAADRRGEATERTDRRRRGRGRRDPTTSSTTSSWSTPTDRWATATTRSVRVPFGEYVPMRGLFEPIAGGDPARPRPDPRRGDRHGRDLRRADGRGDLVGGLLRSSHAGRASGPAARSSSTRRTGRATG